MPPCRHMVLRHMSHTTPAGPHLGREQRAAVRDRAAGAGWARAPRRLVAVAHRRPRSVYRHGGPVLRRLAVVSARGLPAVVGGGAVGGLGIVGPPPTNWPVGGE